MLAEVNIADPKINPTAAVGDLGSLINLFLPLAILGAAILFFVMLMYGGFTILTAGGNPDNIKKAQKIFTFSVIGLILVFTAYLITKTVGFILNIPTPL